MERNVVAESVEKICSFITEMATRLKKEGGVLALSGGLDSAVVAAMAVKALGSEKMHLLHLYERDSQPIHRLHANMFAEQLGCMLISSSISNLLRSAGSYSLLPIHLVPFRRLRAEIVQFARKNVVKVEKDSVLISRLNAESDSWEAKANAYAMAKHRIRMMLIYQYAEAHNLMVIGAANRTEWLTGTFTKFGVDHCADIMPIIHLYRSEVEDLASYLEIPEYICEKAADADVLPGLEDKEQLLGDIKLVDKVLMALEGKENDQISIDGIEQEFIDRIMELMRLSEPMRASPFHLER